jgi:hypothetical protein
MPGSPIPDGSRIVSMEMPSQSYPPLPTSVPSVIVIVDVATEAATIVANGRAAIRLDDHTLLVSV